jgi:soluble lytic murein transglycosylase
VDVVQKIRAAGLAAVLLTAVGLSLWSDTAVVAREVGAEPARATAAAGAAGRLSPEERAAGATLRAALNEARAHRASRARDYRDRLADPAARKLVDWAIVDVMADEMSVAELEGAIRKFHDWPREARRRKALERAKLRARSGPLPYTALANDGAGQAADFRARRLRMIAALRRGVAATAYAAIAKHGQAPGTVAYAEGEAFAGWLALNKLDKPKLADRHFARLEAAVKSPVSKARAAYWRGLVAEQRGQTARAQRFFEQGAVHSTTFYGQLAAEKAGRREIVLEKDPVPDAGDRRRFARAEMTRALRLLAAADERRLLRVFGVHYGRIVETRTELVLLVDELRALGEQEVSLLAYRRGAQHGLILHERGYPLAQPPAIAGGVEPALVLAVVRQESQFDARVRSPADARGMMQILPATGRRLARDLGMAWSDELLWNPDANMRLGSRYLGKLSGRFEGSYLLAVAGYNAGPRRPPDWIQFCGDPRASRTDPLDFIECIPFGETRNYVMKVMANYQMYRARLNGGRAKLTAERSLRRVQAPGDPEGSPATRVATSG